jgi:glycosyltransferase involved in cell wall biosynthesis
MQYHILIPAYNADETISRLLSELRTLKTKPRKIIVIDDGSLDQTVEKVKQHNICLIRLEKNYGKGYALQKGITLFLKENTSDFLLTMDADLQHPVQSIPDLLAFAENKNMDLIIGAREFSFKNMPLHRVLSNKITSWILSQVTGLKIPDSQCGFRLIHREFLSELHLKETGFQVESEMIITAARLKKEIGFVFIPTVYRSGVSNIKNIRDTIHFVRLIVQTLAKKWF